ncbi:uncharacterized protein LOC111665642 [Seriola lalandi dorsalis]|uniref:uncharacterized protein LOC111665642 n=1 Tax=Seriola lalandi dorsalis TaxID=1841481 RepID=UPI000C6F6259|nr:uncharacterized protein LOC111665642 [Seriola lalandi dorsalis]
MAVEETFWFTRFSDNEPVDLRADSEYSGRVQYHCGENDCTLRITDLRESDSAEYKFGFITNQPGGKYTGEPGVTLSVTGLQVKMSESERCLVDPCTWSRLTCHSSCPLPDHPSYIWYESGKNMWKDAHSFKTYFYGENSYACAVKGHEDFPSPSVCVHGSSCNRVTYTDRSICAFKGSSVDISCTYNNYESIKSKFWFSNDQLQRYTRLVDLRKDSQYSGRVQVLEAQRRSTLRITDLTERDSAEYRFKFKTQGFEWESSLRGTTLTVTGTDQHKLIMSLKCIHHEIILS